MNNESKDKNNNTNKKIKPKYGIDVNNFNKNFNAPVVTSEIDTDLTSKSGNDIIASVWKIDPNMANEITNVNRLYTSKYGLFASIPMVCRGTECPYKDVCLINPSERIDGRRCPMEISAILSRFEMWCSHFNIDTSLDAIDPKDLVDVSLIKDLVNIEVQIIRAENKIALNGDFMQTVLVEVDKACNAYYSEDIHPATKFVMELQNRKDKILNQLHSTRKDLAGDLKKSTPSDEAIKLFREIREAEKQELQNKDIMDVEFDELGNIIQEQAEEIIEEEIIEEEIEESVVKEEEIQEVI